MKIDKVHKAVEYWVNRNQNGGMPNPSEFNNLCYISQINVINRHVAKKDGVEAYTWSADEIAAIKKTTTATPSTYAVTRPTDLMYLLTIEYPYTESIDGVVITKHKQVDMIREGELNRRINSAITYPTKEYPMGKWTNTGYDIYPELESVRINYVRMPEKPIWGSTTNARGREVFDEASSTDFELPESMVHELALEILSQMGLNVREAEVVQYANTLKSTE